MKNIILILLIGCVCLGCDEMKHTPLEDIGSVPSTPTVVDVLNYPGGAKVTYSIPNDETLLYVKAIFESHQGVEREVKSSIYKNYIELDGFRVTIEYHVKLYAVNISVVSSVRTSFTIRQLTRPIHTDFETLVVSEVFGVVNTKFSIDF